MNKQTISAAPDENKLEELLAQIQPVPSEHFRQKIEQAAWKLETRKQARTAKTFRLKTALAMMILIALTAVFVTPQGRAWAQEVFQFFKRVNFTSIPLSEEEQKWLNAPAEQYELPLAPVFIPSPSPDIASIPGCETAEDAPSYACQIAYAESKLGFDLMEFPEEPQGLEFSSVEFDIASKSATIGYGNQGGYLSITQGFVKPPEQYGPWSWVPADEVETIKVGSFDGEYVSGHFSYSVNGSELVWWELAPVDQRVAWSDGTRWYLLEAGIGPGTTGYLDRDQLIALAASLGDSPVAEDKQLNPNSLKSISDAEEYSGLDLKAPTLLPLGYGFSYARYVAFNKQVHLRYDGDGYLVIYEWEGEPIGFNTAGQNDETVKVNGTPAFYGSTEGASPYLFLWWHEDGMNYQLYSYRFTDGISGVLDKDKMIAIAESMQDINDFRRSSPKSYEYVQIYERALNIDLKELPVLPKGLAFNNVWADAYAGCITVNYASESTQDRLSLSQCKTDKYYNVFDIPQGAIERVKVGENTGQYIVGWFGVDDTGASVWQSDLPLRKLSWQEDGLWIRITFSGDSAVLYSKEDLILYAESLR